jgi:hypothetical protein
MSVPYNITWDPIPGATGYLIEYKKTSDANWTRPTVPTNPTPFLNYMLQLDGGASYFVRVTTMGTTCAPMSTVYGPFTTVGAACCPVGYSLSPDNSYCYEVLTAPPDPIGGSPTIAMHYGLLSNYGIFGTVFYKMLNPTTVGYNSDGTWDITNPDVYPDAIVYSNSYGGGQTPDYSHFTSPIIKPQGNVWINSDGSTYNNSRLELSGLWVADNVTCPSSTCTSGCQTVVGTYGFARQVNIPSDSIYYVGIGSDDFGSITVDGVTILAQSVANMAGANYFANSSLNQGFRFWHVYPIFLSEGPHTIGLSVTNSGSDGILGMEIYNATLAQLEACNTIADLSPYIFFSTKDIANCQQFDIGSYDCHTHPGYNLVYNPDTNSYSCQKILTTATIEC